MQKIVITFTLLAIFAFVGGCALQAKTDGAGEMQWRCSAANCSDYVTWEEWVNQTCVRDGEKLVCPVITDNQQYLVSLDELEKQVNKSSFKQCRTFVCVEEVPYRVVKPYPVNLTAVSN